MPKIQTQSIDAASIVSTHFYDGSLGCAMIEPTGLYPFLSNPCANRPQFWMPEPNSGLSMKLSFEPVIQSSTPLGPHHGGYGLARELTVVC